MGFKPETKVALLAVAVSCFLAGAIVTGTLDLTPWSRAAPQASGDLEALRRIGQGFSEVVKQVSPSVVNVRVSYPIKESPEAPHPPFGGFPWDFFGESPFGRPFEEPGGEEYPRQAVGSGVILSKDGYVLTNNHVIKGADEITVTTSEGEEYEAEVVGTDPRTDIAVIKVKGKNLPAAKLGDSDRIEVGEWVLAVGNPFQLENTVTAGIISARGRSNVGLAEYEDFIQTDAAVNPGNSGGPLVNLDGEVIGITTAIVTGGRSPFPFQPGPTGNLGIGFAIPINMAKQVMEQLIEKGKVTRGWLGVYIQQITPELKDQFRLKSTEGAIVADVNEGAPAEKAGMRRGDVIVAYRGEKIKDPNNLRNLVAATGVGTVADVKVVRDGKEKTLRVKIGELPEETAAVARPLGRDFETDLGFTVGNLTPSIRRQLELPEDQEGVVVGGIKPTSDAYRNGLRKADVIIEVNRKPISGVGDFNRALSGLSAGEQVLFVVITKGHTRYVTFELGK
jgi:serine protease Do